MRVLIVNTSERTGGAAVAAQRLLEALNNNGVKAKMLVRDKKTEDIKVVGLPQGLRQQWHFLWERWCIFCRLHFSRRHLFDIDIANSGNDITSLREFKEADIIHLHWINQGMLSLAGIRRILDSGKPVVWTMHDMWPATAICHLTLSCERFKTACCACKYLPSGGSSNDLSAKVWKKKQSLFRSNSIFFVACSKWLEKEAKSSALLTGQKVICIPNTVDTHVFYPRDRHEARQLNNLPQDKRIILFVSQRVTNPNKGMNYLIEACLKLAEKRPDAKSQICVALLGGHSEELDGMFPFEMLSLGYVSDERKIASIYSASDLFVLPSLSENLPNTIMESMACGVPCVGFNVGGIPEMIDHKKNGYVAQYKSSDDLAEGLRWILFEADSEVLSREAVHKVATCYSQTSVAKRYIDVYDTANAYKRYKL